MSDGLKTREEMLAAGVKRADVDAWQQKETAAMLDAGLPVNEVNKFWGIKEPEDLPGLPHVNAHIQASFDMLKPENQPRYAGDALEALQATWQTTAVGYLIRGKSANLELPPDADIMMKGASGVGGMADFPLMVAGGVAGGVAAGAATGGNPVGIAAGAGGGAAALPSVIRNLYADQLDHPGGARTWDEFGERMAGVGKEVFIDTAAGVISGVAGYGAAAPFLRQGREGVGALIGTGVSAITEVAAQAGMRMQMPSADDFMVAVVLGLSMHGAGRMVTKARGKQEFELNEQGKHLRKGLIDIWRETGIHPMDTIRAMKEDPALKSELLAPTDAGGNRVQPGWDARKMEDPEAPIKYEPKLRAGSEPQANNEAGLDTIVNLVSELETGYLQRKYPGERGETIRHTIVSPAGAIGYNQIMPGTARQYGFDPNQLGNKEYNIQASRVILADLSERYNGDLEAILIGYNAGPGRANAFLRSGRDYSILPKETRGYLANAERAGVLDRGVIQGEVELQIQALRGDSEGPVHAGRRSPGGDLSWQANPSFKRTWAVRQMPNGTTIPDPDSVASYMQEWGKLAGFKFATGERYWTDGPGMGEYGGTEYNRYMHTPEGGPAFARYAADEGNMKAPRQVWMPRADDSLMRRWLGLGNNEILYHEAGHAINWYFERGRLTKHIPPGTPLEAEIIEASKNFRPFLWEKNPKYNGKPQELMADAFAAWLSNPEMRQRMPEFTKAYGERLKPFLEAAEKALPTRNIDPETGKAKEGWKKPQWEADAEARADEQEKAYSGGGGGKGKPPAPPSGPGLPDRPGPGPRKAPRIDIDPTMRLTEQEHVARFMETMGDPGVRRNDTADPVGWFAKLRAAFEDNTQGFISGAGRRVDEAMGNDPKQVTLQDLARSALGSAGRAHAFLTAGPISPLLNGEQGFLSNASWKRALSELGEDGTPNGFITYMVYERVLDLQQRGIDVGIDTRAAQQYVEMPGVREKYAKAADTLRENKNAFIDYLQAAGLYSKEGAQMAKDLGMYHVSLARIVDNSYVPPAPDGKLGVRQPSRIKGGAESQQMDLLTAEWGNYTTGITMADRNFFIRNVAEALRQHEAKQPRKIGDKRNDFWVIEELPDGSTRLFEGGEVRDANGNPIPPTVHPTFAPFMATRNALQGRLGIGRDDFLFFENGKPMVLRVRNKDLALLLRSTEGKDHGFAVNLAQAFSNIERTGITADPTFTLRSWTVGQVSQWVQSEHGHRPFKGFMKGIMSTWKQDAAWERFVSQGGLGSALSDIGAKYDAVGTTLDARLDSNGVWNVFTDWRAAKEAAWHLSGLEHIRRASSFMDTAARIAYQENAIKKGVIPFKATQEAAKAHLDYREPMAQNFLNVYGKMAPFLTTQFKDVGQFGAAIMKSPKSAAALFGAGVVAYTFPTMLNYAMNAFFDRDKAEDDPTRYDNLPQWMRDMYYVLPEVNGVRIKLPRGISPGAATFGATVERFVDWLRKDDPKGFASWVDMMIDQNVPLTFPTIGAPFLSNYANKGSFGQPLIPNSMEGASGFMQYTPNTSATAKKISQLIGEPTMGEGKGIDISPIKMENVVREWTGPMPLKVLGWLESKLVSNSKPWQPADNPIVGWFFVRNSVGGQKIADFYEKHKEYDKARKDLSLARSRMNLEELQDVNLDKAAFNVEGARNSLRTMRSMINGINDAPTIEKDGADPTGRGLTLDEKRKFTDSLSHDMITMAVNGLKAMREYEAARKQIDKSTPTQ